MTRLCYFARRAGWPKLMRVKWRPHAGFVRFARTVEAKAFIDLVNTDTSYSACFAKVSYLCLLASRSASRTHLKVNLPSRRALSSQETFLGRMQRASDPGSANVYISHVSRKRNVLYQFPAHVTGQTLLITVRL